MTPNLKILFPGKLIFGLNTFSQLIDEVKMLNAKKIFIVTIEPMLSSVQTFINECTLQNIDCFTNVDIVQEPSFTDFEIVLQKAKKQDPDVVIGIGGGSVLDIAKLIAAQIDNTQTLNDIVGIGLLKQRNKKLICIPTTSGTGSEVSPNAILVDNENQKKGIISPYLVPDIVIADAQLTIGLPAAITAATGLDALTHCLEAYTNKFAQPFVDIWAIEGVRLIAENIIAAVNDGNNIEAREKLLLGSLLGGFCLGPVNTAGVHALSYPLGSMYHIAHGLSNAMLLPYVMEFNIAANIKKYADIAIALGCKYIVDDITTANKGVEKIKELLQQCNVPNGLRQIGVKENTIEEMADQAMLIERLLKNNPCTITKQDAINIYKAAY